MRREQVVSTIDRLCRGPNDFRDNVVELVELLGTLPERQLIDSLLECGVIPESFDHSSSNEKLYAKYCDELVAQAFSHIGIPSTIIEERGDSADVLGETDSYTIVADAKAFRLSRTAKNQKDFKIDSLSG